VPVPIAQRLLDAGFDGAHLLLIDDTVVGSELDRVLGRDQSQKKDIGVLLLELTLGTLREVSLGYKIYAQFAQAFPEEPWGPKEVPHDGNHGGLKDPTQSGWLRINAATKYQSTSVPLKKRIRVVSRRG
jgi:hypothetical protein